jgi:acetyltransferase-like isoleucine patch superfamily enzyme
MSKLRDSIFIVLRFVKYRFLLFLLHINLRVHGVVYGKKLGGNRCIIRNVGHIELGDDISLNSYPDGELYRCGLFTQLDSALIKIGNNCKFNGTIIQARDKIIIGDDSIFGHGVVILDSNSHNISMDWVTRRTGKVVDSPVIIGKNVWVGRNSIILKGVRIGDNSIIAAGSVVTKNVPSNHLFGGNPATFIKKLND